MTRRKAEEIAQRLFDGHPAAAALVLEVVQGQTAERRERSRRALLLLDPENPLPGPLEGPARAMADSILEGIVYAPDRSTRQRVASLLQKVCDEAERLSREVA